MVQPARQQRDKTNARWPACGAANTNRGEQTKQSVYKELATSKNNKKNIWQPPEKQDLICELLTSHTHGQNFKQSVLQTNNSTTSSSCQSKACSFKHHHKKQHRENMQGNSTCRTKAWDTYLRDLPQKLLNIGEKAWFPAALLTENLKPPLATSPGGKPQAGSATACSNSPPAWWERFSLAGWETHGRVAEGKGRKKLSWNGPTKAKSSAWPLQG